MNVLYVKVVLMPSGMDNIVLVTDLPNPIWPFEGNLELLAWLPRGKAEEYAREHFATKQIEIINGRRKEEAPPFSGRDINETQ